MLEGGEEPRAVVGLGSSDFSASVEATDDHEHEHHVHGSRRVDHGESDEKWHGHPFHKVTPSNIRYSFFNVRLILRFSSRALIL